MDKYQESLMRGIRFEQFDAITSKGQGIVYENDALKIVQDENITHSEYLVYFAGNNSVISKVEVFENGEYKESPQYTPIQFESGKTFYRKDLVIKVDFNNPIITKIKIYFIDDLADPLEVSIEYIFANKGKYFQKKENERIAELIKKMNVKDSCGDNLVTIKFQNCDECIEKTQIALFNDEKQLMGIFKVEAGMFYKSIINLAYGTYFYKISQYDKNDALIVETDFIKFIISRQYYGGGKPVVTWG